MRTYEEIKRIILKTDMTVEDVIINEDNKTLVLILKQNDEWADAEQIEDCYCPEYGYYQGGRSFKLINHTVLNGLIREMHFKEW